MYEFFDIYPPKRCSHMNFAKLQFLDYLGDTDEKKKPDVILIHGQEIPFLKTINENNLWITVMGPIELDKDKGVKSTVNVVQHSYHIFYYYQNYVDPFQKKIRNFIKKYIECSYY